MRTITLNERFRRNVVKVMSNRGFTNSDLAYKAKVHPCYIARRIMKKGGGGFSIKTLEKISKAFNLSPAELLK